jgi:hypothetical protein
MHITFFEGVIEQTVIIKVSGQLVVVPTGSVVDDGPRI